MANSKKYDRPNPRLDDDGLHERYHKGEKYYKIPKRYGYKGQGNKANEGPQQQWQEADYYPRDPLEEVKIITEGTD